MLARTVFERWWQTLARGYRWWGIGLLCFAVGAQAAESLRFVAPEPLQSLLDGHAELALPVEADYAARATLLQRARELVTSLSATEGYFQPELSWANDTTIQVKPGPITRISSVDISFAGTLSPERQQRLRERWLLPVGAPFRQQDWDKAKQELLRDLDEDAYPAAKLQHSEARIDPHARQAQLHLQITLGPLHRYGPLRITGLSRYSEALVRRYTEVLQPGRPYRRSDLLAVQQALQATPYFDSVQLIVDPIDQAAAAEADVSKTEAAKTDSTKTDSTSPTEVSAPVQLQVQERAPHNVSFGIGASSNTGERLLGYYGFPDLFGQAWDFGTGFRLERERQQYFTDLFFPRTASGNQDGLALLYEHAEFENLAVDRRALRVERVDPGLAFETRYSLTLERSDEQAADEEDVRYQALVPGLQWTWRRVDDIRKPRAGTVFSIDLAAATEELASDASFAYALLHGEYFHAYSPDWVLALRADIGATFTFDSDAVPQSYLFRTGGSQTVRGYDYLSIGREREGAIVGAKRLLVSSVELSYWFNEDWGAAVFVDAGDAKDSMRDLSPLFGYGLGARWQTPAGPLAFDFARGELDSEIRFHFMIAVPF